MTSRATARRKPKTTPRVAKRLVIGCLALVAVLLSLAVVWVSYAQYQRGTREVRTADELDAGAGRWVDAADARLHIREWGHKGGPKLLLVHGTGGWSGTWFTLPAKLGESGWHVVAMDLPPFGLSTAFADGPEALYTRQAQARRILAVVDALGTPVTLVAHSFGSGPSLEAAMHAGSKIRQLVLIDPALGLGPNGEPPSCESAGIASAVLSNRSVRTASLASTATWPGLTATFLRSLVHNKAAITDELVRPYQLPFERVGYTARLGDYVEGFVRGNCEVADSLMMPRVAAWAAGAAPVALIWGDKDTVTPLAQGNALQQLMKGASLTVIRDVGHIPQVESPSDFESTLRSVLAKPG